MAADYLVASLQPLTLDGPAPYTAERFLELCRGQLSAEDADGVAAVMGESASDHPLAARWRDLDAQIRNAVVAERARLLGQDAVRWRRPAEGCSLYWANRASAAFQEKDVARRERLIDQVRWDAAGDLTPSAGPLSVAAVFTYAIRLAVALRRSAYDVAAGKEVFSGPSAVFSSIAWEGPKIKFKGKSDLKEGNT